MADHFYTIEELADHLRVHRSTICRMLRDGQLPGFRFGNGWRFSQTKILEWEKHKLRPNQTQV
jgi:excisionase family DNA binding protein